MTQGRFISYALGIDYLVGTNLILTGQFFQQRIDAHQAVTQEETLSLLTFSGRTHFWNDTLAPEFHVIYDVKHRDFLLRPKLRYKISAHLDFAFGLDLFSGNSTSLLGQFREKDRAYCPVLPPLSHTFLSSPRANSKTEKKSV